MTNATQAATQVRQLTNASAFFSFADTEPAALAHLARLMPEQIVGAYSLISRHAGAAKPLAPRRPQFGHTGLGLFYPK